MKPNPSSYTINRYHFKSIYSNLPTKLIGILLEIIILTLAQKRNVNSNIHILGKAVLKGTLTLAHTLFIDIISNVYMNSYNKTYSNPIGNQNPHISTESEF